MQYQIQCCNINSLKKDLNKYFTDNNLQTFHVNIYLNLKTSKDVKYGKYTWSCLKKYKTKKELIQLIDDWMVIVFAYS